MTDSPREQALARRLRELTTPAPPELHAHVAQLVAGGPPPPPHRAWRLRLGSRIALAPALAAAVVFIGVLVFGSTGAPTVPAMARLALAAASGPPPTVDPADPRRLLAHVGRLAFPRWGASVGYSPVGIRQGWLGGRRVLAVAYRSPTGAQVGYAIADVPPIDAGTGAVETVYGVRYTVAHDAATTIVTWRQSGHTCVLAGRGLSPGSLIALAQDSA